MSIYYSSCNENVNKFIKKSKVEIETQLLGKRQDYINSGSGYDNNGEYLFWILVLDGHGSDQCINFLKTYEWEEIILREPDIVKYINNQFIKFMKIGYVFSRSGSTFSLVKIYKERIVTTNVGDSQISVFVNNDLLYLNEKHNLSNIKEKERVQTILNPHEPVSYYPDHKIASENKLVYTTKEFYCNYINGLTITMTQSLGHNNFLECFPDVKTVDYDSENDKVKVIIGSDGFWDMISLDKIHNNFSDKEDLLNFDVDELMYKVVERWNKTWDYDDIDVEKGLVKSSGKLSLTNIDDVSIGIYSNYDYKNT